MITTPPVYADTLDGASGIKVYSSFLVPPQNTREVAHPYETIYNITGNNHLILGIRRVSDSSVYNRTERAETYYPYGDEPDWLKCDISSFNLTVYTTTWLLDDNEILSQHLSLTSEDSFVIDTGEITPNLLNRAAHVLVTDSTPSVICNHYVDFLYDIPNSIKEQLLTPGQFDVERFVKLAEHAVLKVDIEPTKNYYYEGSPIGSSPDITPPLLGSYRHLFTITPDEHKGNHEHETIHVHSLTLMPHTRQTPHVHVGTHEYSYCFKGLGRLEAWVPRPDVELPRIFENLYLYPSSEPPFIGFSQPIPPRVLKYVPEHSTHLISNNGDTPLECILIHDSDPNQWNKEATADLEIYLEPIHIYHDFQSSPEDDYLYLTETDVSSIPIVPITPEQN
ncbi:MAG: hypothetical protein F6K56_33365 [Moorea sp. SIO3G5]|nr:hypothetical protein [Moorena sp. SIO3G5]